MKTTTIVFFALLTLFTGNNCSAQPTQKNASTEKEKVINNTTVNVYYFHYTRRCATCNAVESVTKEALQELYGENVTFAEYNLDEAAGEAKGKELGISGQTLIIVAGENMKNITNEGFMYARNNPEKLKEVIKETVDKYIE